LLARLAWIPTTLMPASASISAIAWAARSSSTPNLLIAIP
jgi:hypothetical protein